LEGFLWRARLHRILSKDDDYKMGDFRLPSEAFTSTDQRVAEHLLETHFPAITSIVDWLIASSVITKEKIRWLLTARN
jgi:hypothetical protein